MDEILNGYEIIKILDKLSKGKITLMFGYDQFESNYLGDIWTVTIKPEFILDEQHDRSCGLTINIKYNGVAVYGYSAGLIDVDNEKMIIARFQEIMTQQRAKKHKDTEAIRIEGSEKIYLFKKHE